MKSILIVFLTFLLIIKISFAQDSTHNSLKQSKFALQFQIGSSFNLQSFQGTVFSCKYHIFDNSALRFGLSLSNNTETFHSENNVRFDNAESHSIGINFQFIQYLKTVEDISLFIGSGPYYYRSFYKSSSSSNRNNNWSLGLSGVVGVEWFFKHNMSLSAEYGLLFYYDVRNETNYSGDTNYSTKSYNTSNYNMLKFGISVYI